MYEHGFQLEKNPTAIDLIVFLNVFNCFEKLQEELMAENSPTSSPFD